MADDLFKWNIFVSPVVDYVGFGRFSLEFSSQKDDHLMNIFLMPCKRQNI